MRIRRTIAAGIIVAATGLTLLGGPAADARTAPRAPAGPSTQAETALMGALTAPLEAASVALRGRPATQDEIGWWGVALFWGWSIENLARPIALDEGRAQAAVTKLYEDTLGRAPEPDGLAYWTGRFVSDQPIFRLEAGFWASPELYQRAGGTDAAYIDRLYGSIIGRPADDLGRDYWVGRLAAGVRRSTIALRFLNTPEVRGTKADAVFRELFDRPATPAERIEWGPEIVTLGDAAWLVDSADYRLHVTPPEAGPACTLTPVPGTQDQWGMATGMSDDGTQVVLASEVDGLVAGDTDGLSDVFLWDATTGTTTLLSTGAGDASGPSISADGSHVAWSRQSAVAGDAHDIEVWDRATGGIARVTTGPADDSAPAVSDDGRHVAYVARVPDPDAPPPTLPWIPGDATTTDVVVLDRTTGTATALPEVMVHESAPSISPDGRFVAYQSTGRTPEVGGVPKPLYTEHTVALWDRTTGQATSVPEEPGARSIEPDVSDDGSIVALAQVDFTDPNEFRFASTWDVAADEVEQVRGFPTGVSVSGDGSTVAFSSDRLLVAGDDEHGRDVHVRDLATGAIQRPTADLEEPTVQAVSHDGSVILVEGTTIGGSGRTTYLCTRPG